MKQQQRRCPKCQSSHIGHLSGLPDTISLETELTQRALGVIVGREGGQVVNQLVGQREAYVCTECGYLEIYVQDPHRVPFERLEGFSWAQQEHPYR